MTSEIKAIPQHSVHKITSGQVVVDLQTAVKELVENSLDAGATSIEVRFKDYGLKAIEVLDNGSGIKSADYDSVGLKHHTSKLTSFADLESVTSFGFRGEAVSSLCALAESVTMTTATEEEAPMGSVLEFDRMGKLVSSTTKMARQRGTTVTITNLFAPLPVRRAELSRNIKREHSKAVALLTAYAMVPCSKPPGVRLTVSNQPEGGKKTVQLRTDGTPNLRNNIANLWGRKVLEHLADVDLTLEVDADKSMLKRTGHTPSSATIQCRGVMSLPTFASSRTAADRQYLFLNSRPCNLPKVTKAIADVWHSFCVQGQGMWVLDITLPTDAYDVNVSPDKRSILLHNEENMITSLKAALEELWQPTRSTFAVNGGASRSNSGGHSTSGGAAEDDAEVDELEDDTAPSERPVPSKKSAPGGGRPKYQSKKTEERAATWPTIPTVVKSNRRASDERLVSSQPTDAAHRSETHFASSSMSADVLEADLSVSSVPDKLEQVLDNLLAAETSIEQSLEPRPELAGNRYDAGLSLEEEIAVQPTAEGPIQPAASFPIPPPITQIKSESQADARSETRESTKTLPIREPPSPSKEPLSKRRRTKLGTPSQLSIGQFQKGLLRFASGNVAPDATGTAEYDRIPPSDDNLSEVDNHDVEVIQSSIPVSVSQEPSTEVSTIDEETADVVDLTAEDVEMEDVPIVADKIAMSVATQNRENMSGAAPTTVEILRDRVTSKGVLSVDMSRIRSKWAALAERSNLAHQRTISQSSDSMEAAGLKVDSAEQAEATLSRVITKADFGRMVILGQFNLGFVIVRLRKESEDGKKEYDELFIVDQHAADEKFNFESLQQTTRIQSQALFRPRPLELTPADELVALENLAILRENGFDVEEVEMAAADDESIAARQSRLRLTAQPISKNTVFDMKDLEELLHLMQDAPKGQMVRCSKARTMFATRACRRSVMIGMALTRQQMTNVVRHMGTMEQPWNCPHGRPTMRHLLSLPDFIKRMNKKAPISWGDFVSS
ncbi:DNA mismatch repair protein MutL [Dacryopinax primogenitus]|uniref:DNA mismatch repair protein PMS1 n=1 Tax=Dacryopinax primogenitus (strain DJM 731) TaxID=1858805 RepID=M5G398_DACPD|nr:DNA mismatch repair protein MutL [Dacryopinax primogenitus]EJU03169.1 DNA mismatch repair protein MutL [Dacryopinax primogenitus]